jgi:hypothetical protein
MGACGRMGSTVATDGRWLWGGLNRSLPRNVVDRMAGYTLATAADRELLRACHSPVPAAALPAWRGRGPAAVREATLGGVSPLPRRGVFRLRRHRQPHPPACLGATHGGSVGYDGLAAGNICRRPQPPQRPEGRALAGPLPPDLGQETAPYTIRGAVQIQARQDTTSRTSGHCCRLVSCLGRFH